MKHKLSMVLAGLLICGSAIAEEQRHGFVKVAESEEMVLFVNFDSFKYNHLGEIPIFGAVVQEFNKMGGGSSFRKEYVLESDCRKGNGKIFAHGLDDREVTSSTWVRDSGNVASTHAEVLCQVASWDKLKK
ncbi:hypothetical protein [Delftia acidovorans]|uniref:hypothetical protein n=1 Tax=Delftia acidovorans TaxID=80866 RepID=UPI00242BA3A3|nr:hypothetical protein [Delftia acidovorans]